MQDLFDIDADMRRTESTSTLVSEALTFYSAPTSFSHSKESEFFTRMDTVLGQNRSTDSGFAESLLERKDNASTARSTNTPHSAQPTVPEKEPLQHDTLCRPSYQAQQSPTTHRRTSRTTIDSSSNLSALGATVVPKVSSRRTSITQAFATIDHEAQQSSRRSSSRHAPPSAMGSRPQSIRNPRRRSTLSSGATFDDPYLTHQRAQQMFQSFGSTLSSEPAQNNDYQEPLIGPAILPLPLTHARNYEGGLNMSPVSCSERGTEGTIYDSTRCTIIDWTAPATRRREYEKIDRASRGVRGLWRKVTPRWCRSSSRTSFFDGDEDDARSVRRYRLDISEENDAEKEEGIHVTERELRPSLFRSKTTWSCFSFEGGKKTKPL
ncbi:hypothetical protein MMC32_002495 [Xylographa parallela]|nr:hypothetical protein [Xylographa parallela]